MQQVITVKTFSEYRKVMGPRHVSIVSARDSIAEDQSHTLLDVIRSHAAGNKVRLPALRKALGFKPNGNSKIHGSCVSYHPSTCRRGKLLANVEGSVCQGCYAERLARFYKETDVAWVRNAMVALDLLKTDPEAWIKGMATVINATAKLKARKNKPLLHRWFESGDLFSDAHLEAIVEVAKLTPSVTHWLPTREGSMVRRVASKGALPDNLTIRLSADMIGQSINILPALQSAGIVGSEVITSKTSEAAYVCPATVSRDSCDNCQACWSKDVTVVAYVKH